MNEIMTKNHIEDLIKVYRDDLLNDCIPFWLKHGYDRQFGGIMTSVDRDGSLLDTDKGGWQQGRFAWVLGYMYNNIEKRPEYLEALEGTLKFIRQHCFDVDGRMFFEMTRDGKPLRKRRYCYSEAFAAIAFGEHAKATGNQQSKAMAENLYHIYANHIPYPPKTTGVRPMKAMGIPMIKIVTAQRLRDSIGLVNADADIDEAIEEITRDFMKYDIKCCMENVGPDGEIYDHFNGRILNPGHAIEGAWFIMYEGKVRNNKNYVKAGLDILDWTWERGWDKEFGGIFYYRDVYNKPVFEYWHDMKFWWPQNETIIATLLAYQLTGDEKYARMHQMIHKYTYSIFPDREFGDWFGYFHRDGRRSNTIKGNMIKGCFHLPRQQIECWRISEEIKNGQVGLFK